MLSDFTIFVNAHSSCRDCLPLFFGQLQKFWPSHPRVVLGEDGVTDLLPVLGRYEATSVDYSAATRFTGQYGMLLCAVETTFVLTMLDDYFLIGDVNESALADCLSFVTDNQSVGFVVHDDPQPYSMQATIWRTQSLKRLYAEMTAETPWEAELEGIEVSKRLGFTRLVMDGTGTRRGKHCDSTTIPYIATALNKGKWSLAYKEELEPMLKQYGINANKRGWA